MDIDLGFNICCYDFLMDTYFKYTKPNSSRTELFCFKKLDTNLIRGIVIKYIQTVIVLIQNNSEKRLTLDVTSQVTGQFTLKNTSLTL